MKTPQVSNEESAQPGCMATQGREELLKTLRELIESGAIPTPEAIKGELRRREEFQNRATAVGFTVEQAAFLEELRRGVLAAALGIVPGLVSAEVTTRAIASKPDADSE